MAKNPREDVHGQLDRELTRLSREANKEGLSDDEVIRDRLRKILFALEKDRLSQAKTLIEGFDTVLDNRKRAKEREERDKKQREEQQKKKKRKK